MSKNKILLVLFLSATLINSVFADFSDGDAAYNSGDFKGALNEWTQVAEEGDARAQYNVGWMHANGIGTAQDFKEGSDWYIKSASQGLSLIHI